VRERTYKNPSQAIDCANLAKTGLICDPRRGRNARRAVPTRSAGRQRRNGSWYFIAGEWDVELALAVTYLLLMTSRFLLMNRKSICRWVRAVWRPDVSYLPRLRFEVVSSHRPGVNGLDERVAPLRRCLSGCVASPTMLRNSSSLSVVDRHLSLTRCSKRLAKLD